MDMNQILAWTKQADVIFQTPLVRMAVLPLLKAMLPSLGVTPQQMIALDEHYDDLTKREAEARRRSMSGTDSRL